MKKILLFNCLFLVSCFDIFHYMEINSEKKFHSEYRIRFSKVLFSMAQEQGGNGLSNFNLDELLKKLESAFPLGKITAEKKESDTALIFHIKYDGKEIALDKKISADIFPVVPYKDEFNQYVLLFLQKQKNQTLDGNMMAEAILSGPVYRILLGGELKPKSANFITATEVTKLDIIPLGTQFLIEFPISSVMKSDSSLVISFNAESKLDSIQNFLKKTANPTKTVKDVL